MRKRLLYFSVIILLSSSIFTGLSLPDSPKYLPYTAQSGDGILSVMRRYQLSSYSCNFKKFYELNSLNKNSQLIQGRKYFLPIALYPFNGKTIRSSLGIADFDLAFSIQKYNEAMLSAKLREQTFQQDKSLWVPHHFFNCAKPDLNLPAPQPAGEVLENLSGFGDVSNPGKRLFPIFGPKYSYTPLLSNKLQGRIYYLISGHGGPDPGALSKRAGSLICEDEYAYDVTLRLCRKLIENGATAYMIVRDPNDGIRSGNLLKCDEDEVVWGGAKIFAGQSPRLYQRTDIINSLSDQNRKLGFNQQTVIEIHVDSRSRGEQVDLFFYHQNGSDPSKKLAETLHQTIKGKYRLHRQGRNYHGTVTTRDLHTLRETKPSAVYIELGNIRNALDQQRIVLESNREALAKWLYEGLIK